MNQNLLSNSILIIPLNQSIMLCSFIFAYRLPSKTNIPVCLLTHKLVQPAYCVNFVILFTAAEQSLALPSRYNFQLIKTRDVSFKFSKDIFDMSILGLSAELGEISLVGFEGDKNASLFHISSLSTDYWLQFLLLKAFI